MAPQWRVKVINPESGRKKTCKTGALGPCLLWIQAEANPSIRDYFVECSSPKLTYHFLKDGASLALQATIGDVAIAEKERDTLDFVIRVISI